MCLINSFYDPLFLQCCLPFQNLKSKLYKLVSTLLIEFCNYSCGLLHQSRNSGGLWPLTGIISHLTSVLRKIRSQLCSCSNTRYIMQNLEGYPAFQNSVECQVFLVSFMESWSENRYFNLLDSDL